METSANVRMNKNTLQVVNGNISILNETQCQNEGSFKSCEQLQKV